MRVQVLTGEQQTITVPPEIIQHLNSMAHNPHQQYYDELSSLLQSLRTDSIVLLDSCKNLGVPVAQYFPIDLANSLISPESARTLALQAYPAMRASIRVDQSTSDQLAARQLRVLERVPQIEELQKSLSIAINASISESLIQFGTLPDELNLLINPLIESLATEKTAQLQQRSAKALALLMSLSQERSDNLNGSIVDRLVTFLKYGAKKPQAEPEESEDMFVEPSQQVSTSGDSLISSDRFY